MSFSVENIHTPGIHVPWEKKMTPEQREAMDAVAEWCEEERRWPVWKDFEKEWLRCWPGDVPSVGAVKRMVKARLLAKGQGKWL